MEENNELLGQISYIVFRNEDTGYTVAKFTTEQKNEKNISITGIFNSVDNDSLYRLYGQYIQHPTYGIQFKVEKYDKLLPTKKEGIVKYLSSSIFKGIGKKTAESIVEFLGEDAINILRTDFKQVELMPGMNDKRIAALKFGVQMIETEDIASFLVPVGFSLKNIMKIEATYKERAKTVLEENPYTLFEDIVGVSFKNVDKLGRILNFEDKHPYRVRGIILNSLKNLCFNTGDTYVEDDRLYKFIVNKYGFDEQEIKEQVFELIKNNKIIIEANKIYYIDMYLSQETIVKFLSNIKSEIKIDFDIDKYINDVERIKAITYDDIQKEAIKNFFTNSFSIISGGPGTGKTTIVAGILEIIKLTTPYDKIMLVAPTGRASKRLSQLSEFDASTIHSLLEWDLETNTFQRGYDNPIDTEILIIDEFSMVDQILFSKIIDAGIYLKKVLIIGDENQLPSVSPGMVLKDLILSNKFTFTRLHKIYRQKEGSEIIDLAINVNKGLNTLKSGKEIAYFACKNYQATNLLTSIISNALDKGYDLDSIQVLIPRYDGVAGIDNVNLALQTVFNPKTIHKRELRVGSKVFREDDKILQLKNQSTEKVYNGDIGYIKEIIYANEDELGENRIIAMFEDLIVEYTNETLFNITHAFAVSIHKAQGSEYPIVIMPIFKDYYHMLSKQLIYTGITRAKSSLIILGESEYFEIGIKDSRDIVRNTSLLTKILNNCNN